jgi:hypothetical protein
LNFRGAEREIKHRSTEVTITTKAVIYVVLSSHSSSTMDSILLTEGAEEDIWTEEG